MDKVEYKRVELRVDGMDCTNCALGIKKQLEKNGFQSVDVNFASSEVSFSDVDENRKKQAIDKIRAMGYSVIEENEVQEKSYFTIENKFIISLAFTVPLLVSMFLPFHIFHDPYFQLLLTLPVFAIGLWHFGRNAFQSLKSGVPNMDVLIVIGATAAFAYSLYGTLNNLGDDYQFYETAASIITIVLFGNLLEHSSVKRTTSAIDELVKLQKIKAKKISLINNVEVINEIEASKIKNEDKLLINTGDKIPTDGNIYWGNGSIDESMISGESIPVDKAVNAKVVGGTILSSGSIKIIATAIGKETVLSQIIEMVKQAQQDKPRMQNLADKIAAIFVPLVTGISVVTFLISFFIFNISFQSALMHSIAVLVIACPCALGLAIPTAVVVGIGRVAKNGILIKGGSTLEEFAEIKRIVFDKTGTLTTGKFEVKKLVVTGVSEEKVKSILYSLEKHSSHPIAKSIVEAYEGFSLKNFINIKEQKGLGIEANDEDGNSYKVGSFSITVGLTTDDSHSVYLIENNKLIAWLDVEDEIKLDAKETINFFKSRGIITVLLSGDRKNKCEYLAKEIGINEVYFEKLPEEKLKIIEEFTKTGNTAMVGDGINDALALAKATVGISLSNATQIAIKSAQVILLKGNLSLLPKAFSISRITLTAIKQNLFWAFFYNIIAIPFAAFGLLNPMLAAATMAFSDIIVVSNSLRLRNKKI